MFITRTEKKLAIIYLDRENEKEEYENLLNDPSVVILERVFASTTETSYEGESSMSIERPYVRVEYEKCSI